MTMSMFYLYAYDVDYKYEIDKSDSHLSRALFFHTIVMFVCIWIIMLATSVCINCKDYNKHTYHKINCDINDIDTKDIF